MVRSRDCKDWIHYIFSNYVHRLHQQGSGQERNFIPEQKYKYFSCEQTISNSSRMKLSNFTAIWMFCHLFEIRLSSEIRLSNEIHKCSCYNR